MERIIPPAWASGLPCSMCAVACAFGAMPTGVPAMRSDGYATLASANKFIRANLPVRRRKDYKRGERKTLSQLFGDPANRPAEKAVVCVLGHYVYVDGTTYWSFFENDDDEVVAIWELD